MQDTQDFLCLSNGLSDEKWPQDLKPFKEKAEKMISNLKRTGTKVRFEARNCPTKLKTIRRQPCGLCQKRSQR